MKHYQVVDFEEDGPVFWFTIKTNNFSEALKGIEKITICKIWIFKTRNYGGQRMNITLEDYLENHAFCDYENTEAAIRIKIKDSIYFLDQDTFDYFCNDYVKDVEVSIDGNEYGVWLLVVIELNRYE